MREVNEKQHQQEYFHSFCPRGKGKGERGLIIGVGKGGGQKLQIMEGVTLGEWSSKGY